MSPSWPLPSVSDDSRIPRQDSAAAAAVVRRGRRGWLTVIVVLVVAALLGVIGGATLTRDRGRSLVAQVDAGKRVAAPDWRLPVLWAPPTLRPEVAAAAADRLVELSELRGTPVVLNFWASWCAPCREETPLLNELARTRGESIIVIGVNVQDVERDALGFLREFDVPFVSVRSESNEIYRSYGLTGVPETFFVDASGRVAAHIAGQITPESLDQAVDDLLKG